MTFDEIFTFARPNRASYRSGHGTKRIADVDRPRFDHDEAGQSLGLLVQTGGATGEDDRVGFVVAPVPPGSATILHRFRQPDGRVERRVLYTYDATSTMIRCLRLVAHHQEIAAYHGFLQPRSGRIRALGQWWSLPSVMIDTGGFGLGVGARRALIES